MMNGFDGMMGPMMAAPPRLDPLRRGLTRVRDERQWNEAL
jgi:hypothetical protein